MLQYSWIVTHDGRVQPRPTTKSTQVEVTVVVPARNEAADIATALGSLAAQDFDPKQVEILVVDGGSADHTAERSLELLGSGQFSVARVESNPSGTTPSNLNHGLRCASGRILCRVDARSIVPSNYLRRCVELLDQDPRRVVVGGSQVAVARSDGTRDRGIARGLNNRWGMGLSRYRRGARSGPTDTVYLGAFRTADLRRVGGWDETFHSNQDFELNRRLGRFGIVWFDDELEVGYLPRRTIHELFVQYRRFGQWKAIYWRRTGDYPRLRQVLLLLGPVLLLPVVAAAFRRKPLVTLSALAAGAVAVDHFGSAMAPAPLTERAVALAALASTSLGWTTGVWESLVRRG